MSHNPTRFAAALQKFASEQQARLEQYHEQAKAKLAQLQSIQDALDKMLEHTTWIDDHHTAFLRDITSDAAPRDVDEPFLTVQFGEGYVRVWPSASPDAKLRVAVRGFDFTLPTESTSQGLTASMSFAEVIERFEVAIARYESVRASINERFYTPHQLLEYFVPKRKNTRIEFECTYKNLYHGRTDRLARMAIAATIDLVEDGSAPVPMCEVLVTERDFRIHKINSQKSAAFAAPSRDVPNPECAVYFDEGEFCTYLENWLNAAIVPTQTN